MNLLSGWLVVAIGLLILISFLLVRASAKAPVKVIRRGSLVVAILSVVLCLQNVSQYIWASTIPVEVSTAPFWPKAPTEFHFESNATATYVAGGFETAGVEVAGVSLATRAIFAIAIILLTVVVVAIALFVSQVSKTIESGSSLSQALVSKASAAGWVVLVAGLSSSVLDLIGRNFVQAELFGTQRSFGFDPEQMFANPWFQGDTMNYDKVFGILMPSPQFFIDIWPVVIALSLLLVSKILNRANILEQEVDGLV